MKTRICIISIICVILLPFVFPVFSPWSRINSTEHDVDIDTGRHRVSSYLYWTRTNVIYRETSISAEIYSDSLNTEEGNWVRVSSFGPFVDHSPHYAYHGATSQMKTLPLVWSDNDSDKAEREKHSRMILDLWAEHGNDRAVDDYIHHLIFNE